MAQTETNTPSANTANFASMLASMATPAKKSGWSNEGLADDVATLSYEHALRAHARYRPESYAAAADDQSLTQVGDSDAFFQPAAPTAPRAAVEAFTAAPPPLPAESYARYEAAPAFQADRGPEPNEDRVRRASTRHERNLLRASVTIRMSEVECEQLHRRAAEAGVTISSYLRSCTFEAEALRTQVKETMAQLRALSQPMKNAAIAADQNSLPIGFWARLWSRIWPQRGSTTSRRMARA